MASVVFWDNRPRQAATSPQRAWRLPPSSVARHAAPRCGAAPLGRQLGGAATCSVVSVGGATGIPGWQEVEHAAPAIARLGAARLDAMGLAMLGTLRRDGSPRISPVEPCIAGGQLLIGVMAWSAKARDLQRDPRYVLHSVVTSPDSGDEELKLYGSAAIASHPIATAAAGAWWLTHPDRAIVFRLGIHQAVFIVWDTANGLMTIHRWSPRDGYRQSGRAYP